MSRSPVVRVDEAGHPGTTPAEKVGLALKLLGGLESLVRSGQRVLLKPNLVAPFPRATTHLEIVAAMVEAVRVCGAEPVVAESSGFEFDTRAAFDLLGFSAWAAAQGVPLLNLDEGPFIRIPSGLRRPQHLEIARATWEADVVINLPRLKRHNVTGVTLGLKNLMGLLSRDSRRALHALDLERGIAALADLVRPQLTVVDGLAATARAVYGPEQPLGVIIAGRDPVAVDHYGCLLLGVPPQRIGHIQEAARRSLGQTRYQVLGDIAHLPPPEEVKNSWRDRLYRFIFRTIHAVDIAFSCLRPGRSLIPTAHYWLALRPHVRADLCDRCGVCERACPAGAIDAARARIIASRCMQVRCLRCLEACPRQAIELRGWRRPERL